ncbi:phosphonate metabolism protein/1,5-bisphosphokinase (PRPP-forming) PhnN [Advenella sp. S44]|uniref:phosphonate metabolism protein/1,5-bisphosphokinase (PRPP-forming) PhnN n=1 Tax=Advenella sp. S44 TaxID=1982755 RepID=UPI000C2A10C8|nr:phosphonate metabolism protein/1,5-bisphosphokinase (PRPP-forming) PhnN [Advenella sp. S44]PJX25447.1 phosphonate metabolism protein/1,5-bisphosphokinase (PRPP-forming) PhnN [Advenella sp. S44]
MSGQLVYVMGPSGSGKDSLLQQATRRTGSRLHLMKRYITRSAESEGEDAFSVSPEDFDAMQARGAFAMSWRANGLAYGIPAELDTRLAQGQTVLVNGSRAYCESAVQLYQSVLVVLVQVESQLLLQRLLRRGRESVEEITERLARNTRLDNTFIEGLREQGARFAVIDNSADLDSAVTQFLDTIEQATISEQQ